MRWVEAAVGGAHFELEHAIELVQRNQLPDWLRNELLTALLEVEGVQQRLGQ
jgi:hypothetical protein